MHKSGFVLHSHFTTLLPITVSQTFGIIILISQILDVLGLRKIIKVVNLQLKTKKNFDLNTFDALSWVINRVIWLLFEGIKCSLEKKQNVILAWINTNLIINRDFWNKDYNRWWKFRSTKSNIISNSILYLRSIYIFFLKIWYTNLTLRAKMFLCSFL